MIYNDITKLTSELDLINKQVESDEMALANSKRPLVEKIFLNSTRKLQIDMQRELKFANLERAHELVKLRLLGNQMDGSIRLKTLCRVIEPFTTMLEHSSWRAWDKDGDSKRLDDKFSSLLDLRLGGINTGSTELVILGNTTPDLTGTSALQVGLESIFETLKSPNENIQDHVNDIGGSASKALLEFVTECSKQAIALELSWSAPGSKLYWEGRPAEISRIQALLDDIGEPTVETLRVRGVVQVLSVRNKLEILNKNKEKPEKIIASYHHSMIDEIQDLHLGDTRDFIIEKTSYPFGGAKKKRAAFRLKNIELVDYSAETN